MNRYLSDSDMTSHVILEKLKKNERAARDAMALISKRHRKLEPGDAFEQIANTIGILCAELVQGGANIGGNEFAKAMLELVNQHMNRRVSIIKTQRKTP
jgi:hypothetical protein